MATKLVDYTELSKEIVKIVDPQGNGFVSVTTDYINEELKDRSFGFNTEELCRAINFILREGLATLGLLYPSEENPSMICVVVTFDCTRAKNHNFA